MQGRGLFGREAYHVAALAQRLQPHGGPRHSRRRARHLCRKRRGPAHAIARHAQRPPAARAEARGHGALVWFEQRSCEGPHWNYKLYKYLCKFDEQITLESTVY